MFCFGKNGTIEKTISAIIYVEKGREQYVEGKEAENTLFKKNSYPTDLHDSCRDFLSHSSARSPISQVTLEIFHVLVRICFLPTDSS